MSHNQNPITRPLGFNPVTPNNLNSIMTLAILFLSRNNGHYASHSALRKRITAWLNRENDYGRDLTWFESDRDMEILVDKVMVCGGVSVGSLPMLEGVGQGERKKRATVTQDVGKGELAMGVKEEVKQAALGEADAEAREKSGEDVRDETGCELELAMHEVGATSVEDK